MARNPVTHQAKWCPACGAKIRADRRKCPRCDAQCTQPDPAASTRTSRRLARWSAGFTIACGTLLGGLWLVSESDHVATATPARAGDPLAARRLVRAIAGSNYDTSDTVVVKRPSLVDAAGEGMLAYGSGELAVALEKFQQAVAANPQDAESSSNLGQVLVRLGRILDALPHYERAIRLNPDRWAYRFNLARALGLLGRWDESIAAYRQAQQLFPDDYVTAFNLALALHKNGDDAAAVDEYRKAIALQPDDPSFHFALALSYERLRRTADAVSAYEEYLRLAPAADDADKVRAHLAALTSH